MKILLAALFLTNSFFAQTKEHNPAEKHQLKIQALFEKLAEQKSFVTKCETKTRKSQIKKFGKILSKIAGECEWGGDGCPVNLVKPNFPASAVNNKISGSVDVEIIINENGKVVYSKSIKGHKLFFAAARLAAFSSHFRPLTLCEKRILQKKIIRYNFILD